MSRGAPSIGCSLRPRGVSRRGTLCSRPSVYGCRGEREDAPPPARLHDHPAVHHVHALAHAGDDAEVVRDHDERGVALGDERAQQVEDLRLDRHVERGRRLVGDQELRLARERHRDHRALPHAAGELVRVVVGAPARLRDADLLEQLDRRALAPPCVEPEVRLERLADLPPDRQHRVQRRHRVLEDHRDLPAADRPQLGVRAAEQVAAFEQRLPAR